MVTFTDRDDLRQSYTGRNPVDRSSVSGPNRDRIREARSKGQLNRVPRSNIFQKGFDKASQGMSILPTPMGVASYAADNLLRNSVMHGQNKSYFGGNWLHDKIPNKVKESLMTPSDQAFYDKYTNLASMAQDTTKRDYYLQQAKTAMQNAQITGRLNYGLGSLIDTEGEYLNKEGLPSYTEDLFDEGYDRFDEERFKEAMGYEEPITFLPQDAYEGSGMKTDPFYNYIGASADAPDIVNDMIGDDTITNNYMEEVIDPENISPYNYDQYYHLNPRLPGGTSGFSGVQEYLDKLTKDPDNPNYKRDEKELLRELIKDGYILEGMPQ